MTEQQAMMSQSVDQVFAALADAQQELPNVKKGETAEVKNKEGRFLYKYSFADLGAAVEACAPVTSKHGLSVLQIFGEDENSTKLVTILGHKSGQWICSRISLPYGGTDPQEWGKTITYFRRYAYLAILGVATEDDDAQGAAGKPPAQRPTRPAMSPASGSRDSQGTGNEPPPLFDGPPDGESPRLDERDKREADAISKELDRLGLNADPKDPAWGKAVERMRRLGPPYFFAEQGKSGFLQDAYRSAMRIARQRTSGATQ